MLAERLAADRDRSFGVHRGGSEFCSLAGKTGVADFVELTVAWRLMPTNCTSDVDLAAARARQIHPRPSTLPFSVRVSKYSDSVFALPSTSHRKTAPRPLIDRRPVGPADIETP